MALFDKNNFLFFQFGRHAFLEILKIINVKSGDKVLVPSYICKDFLAPIYMLGAKPLFYLVNSDLSSENLPADPSIKAVVMVNYFGFPQNLDVFEAYSKSHQIPLIEDNSHGLFGKDIENRTLGMRGDFGIFSFRKSLIVPDGGILYIKKSSINNNIFDSKRPSIYFLIKSLFYKLQVLTKIPINYPCLLIIRAFRYYKYGFFIKPPTTADQYQAPPTKNVSKYSFNVLNNINVTNFVSNRRTLYKKIEIRLKNYQITPVFSTLSEGVSPYCYPFFSNTHTALEIQKIARRMGLDCYRWPDLPEQVKDSAPKHYTNLWVIGFIC